MTEGNPGSTGYAAFEARMRNRRFSRCIEHATGALQSGAMEEVRDALDEARVLCPDAPEIAELESRIAALPSPSALLLAPPYMSVQEPPAGWLRVIGAMCVLVLLFGLFGFGLAQLYFNAPLSLLTDAGPAQVSPAVTQAPPAVASEAPAEARVPAQSSATDAPRTSPETPGAASHAASTAATAPAPAQQEPGASIGRIVPERGSQGQLAQAQ